MSVTREDNNLIFPQNLFLGDCLYVYDAGDNNVLGLIHLTPDGTDTM